MEDALILQISETIKTKKCSTCSTRQFYEGGWATQPSLYRQTKARGTWLVHYKRDMEFQQQGVSGNQSLRRVPCPHLRAVNHAPA